MYFAESERLEEVYEKRNNGLYTHFDQGQLYLVQQQDREMLGTLRSIGLSAKKLARMRIFEVGCGTGYLLRNLIQWGADPRLCAGADIRSSAIERGKRISPNLRMFYADCSDTGELADCYDLVLQNIVFSSVPREHLRRSLAREMVRITKPGGAILWCDLRYNNPRNQEVRAVGKNELMRLFDDCKLHSCKPILLAPPIARKLANISKMMCDILYFFPFLRGHYLAVFFKPT